MSRMMWTMRVSIVLAMFCLSTGGARAANVLFVTVEDGPLDADDVHLVTFLEGLGHTVILIDDNEDQPTTQAAALEADVVFISESVSSGNIRTEITAVETPIIVAESWGWDEMGLTTGTTGGLAVTSTDVEIVKPGHFLAAGLKGTVPVLNATGSARFGTGIAGNEATVIARATLSDGQTYDVIYVYEKGAALPVAPADGSSQVAAGMRICFGFDELSVVEWNDNAYALLEAAVGYAVGGSARASNPHPSDGQEDVSRNVVMSWTPGEDAQSHNLYFGATFEDVNDADVGSPLLAGPGLDANTFDPGLLAYDQTCYWRVDEIGAPPESKVVRGDVWSFTAEPFAPAIRADRITATASSSLNADMGPSKTVDGSGLDASGRHDTASVNMWMSAIGQEPPVWIQYELDAVYKLYEMWVWNANTDFESLIGLGVKTATIEYSTDGATWTALANVPEFAQAPGAADYAHDTTVDFGGVAARFVRITCTSNWGGRSQYSLSEVRFLHVPVSARDPNPADEAMDVPIDTTLSWRAGREAASHEVHFGTDMQAVTDSTAPAATVSQAQYAPANLQLDTTYYWKVVEVNQAESPSAWDNKVWSFSTQPYLLVEDFEDYTDDEGSRIYETWVDGYGTTTNGSQVGYVEAPFAEKSIVHSGSQSMPLSYEGPSETTRTFDSAQDWTRAGVKTLTLYVQGKAGNVAGQFYVKVNSVGKAVDVDFTAQSWQAVNVDLAGLGVDLQHVTSLAISIQGAGSGMVFIDDIRLHP